MRGKIFVWAGLVNDGANKIVFFDFLLRYAIKVFGDLPEKLTFVPDKGIALKRAAQQSPRSGAALIEKIQHI